MFITDRNKSSICLIIAVLILSSLNLGISNAQCNTDTLTSDCASRLGTYNYIRSFSFNTGQKKKTPSEYSYIFSKGSEYLFVVCEDDGIKGKMVLGLYDKDHNLVASTYNKEEDKHYSLLHFTCSSTGVYYLKGSFPNARKGCAICIMGFNKGQTENSSIIR